MLFYDWPCVVSVGGPFPKVLIFPEIWLPAQPCQYLHSLTTLIVSAIPVLINGVLSNLFRFHLYLFILWSISIYHLPFTPLPFFWIFSGIYYTTICLLLQSSTTYHQLFFMIFLLLVKLSLGTYPIS